MFILEVERLRKRPHAMFDLEFFKIVKKILGWSEAPESHYANEHERHMMMREPAHAHGCLNQTLTLPGHIQVLSMYVSRTYPAYFGFELNIGKAFFLRYHEARKR